MLFPALQIKIVTEKVTEVSTMDLIMDSNGGIGWLINLGLLALLGYSVFIIAERYQTLNRALREEEDFVNRIKNLLLEGNMEAARKLCVNSESPSARMLEKGIARIGKPAETIAVSMENTGKLEIIRLKRRLRFLALTSGTGPLVGLLGTIFSLYSMYTKLDNSAVLNAKILSNGSMVAMITLAFGLIVGIISYIFYQLLLGKVESVQYQMEKDSIQFMDLLFQPVK